MNRQKMAYQIKTTIKPLKTQAGHARDNDI
jgi:hypothetical protein